MQLLIASGFLDLGLAPSAFGVSLALIITFVLSIGGLATFLIGYTISQVMVERKQNQERIREYDARHRS
ncbi:MAG: hypothetical protein M0T77_12405 [Actinomycetota bacterium]|nr:hypothetical protein [Actinomycetota bacterium]